MGSLSNVFKDTIFIVPNKFGFFKNLETKKFGGQSKTHEENCLIIMGHNAILSLSKPICKLFFMNLKYCSVLEIG
jgi:hypothetical protein